MEKFDDHKLSPSGFCLVPFTNLILEPGGEIGVCRHKGTEFTIGNLKNSSLEDLWNGHFLTRWRTEFLEGNPKICSKEIKHQKCNLCSYNNELLDQVEFEALQSRPFIKLTANLNGQCNLKCQMCHVWKLPNGFYTEENFWAPARKTLFPKIKEIDMLSGEPFLQADTFKLIDEVSALNPECRWMFTTNSHWSFSERVEHALSKIKIKYVVFSVDSLNSETYRKIRYPGHLPTVLNNITSWLNYNKERRSNLKGPIEFHWNFLVQKDNWREIPEVITYCLERDIIPFITFLYEPNQFSLLDLPEKERQEILESWFRTLTPLEINLTQRAILPMIQSLENKADQAQFYLVLKESKSWLKDEMNCE